MKRNFRRLNMMKKVIGLCLVGGALLTSSASADYCCESDRCGGSWEFGVDFLYWHACACPFDFGAAKVEYLNEDDQAVSDSSIQRVKPSNHPGWRLNATYLDGCKFYTLDWLYLRATDSSEAFKPLEGDLTVPPFGAVNYATAQMRNTYNRVNFRAGYTLHEGCCISSYTYLGARLIDINQYRNTFVEPGGLREKDKAEYAGFGVEWGVGGEYITQCGLGIATRMAATLTVGEQKYRSEILSLNPVRLNYHTYTHCVPGYDFRLGINYAKECDCWSALIEIGYELQYYFNAIRVQGRDQGASPELIVTTHCANIGFGGPYISLQLAF
jgi:hypothetical protein